MQIRESYSKYFDKESRMSRNQIKVRHRRAGGTRGVFFLPRLPPDFYRIRHRLFHQKTWLLLQIFKPSAGSVMYIHGLHHCFATKEFVHAPDCTMGWNIFWRRSAVLVLSPKDLHKKTLVDSCQAPGRSCQHLNFCFPGKTECFYWLRTKEHCWEASAVSFNFFFIFLSRSLPFLSSS